MNMTLKGMLVALLLSVSLGLSSNVLAWISHGV